MSGQAIDKIMSTRLTPYDKFKMVLKSKEVQRQYPNLLQRFLDFCQFDGLTIEIKASRFYDFAVTRTLEELEDLIIKFILIQKERIDKKEITSGTLKNYIKAIKLFCKMNRINVQWDIISSSIPRVKQYSMIAIGLDPISVLVPLDSSC